MKFTKIIKAFEEALSNVGYARAAHALLKLDDRQLEDAGLSRELLKQGPKAWPWKLESDYEYALKRKSTVSASVSTLKPATAVEDVEETSPNEPKTPLAA